MKLNILGAGGATAIPRPLCCCEVCEQARAKGITYARTGPSLYIDHGGGILIDTPEEVRYQIEREQIKSLSHIFYTHWHPDHTQGMRIIEQIKHKRNQPNYQPLNVYIPANDIKNFQIHCAPLWYFEGRRWANIIEFDDRSPIEIDNLFITPIDFKRPDRVRYGFLIQDEHKKVMYAPCSIFGAQTDHNWRNLDYLIMESGWAGPTSMIRAKEHGKTMYQDHISLEENVDLSLQLQPKQTILTHIDGGRHRDLGGDYDLLCCYMKGVLGAEIAIAYDGMRIEL